MSIYNSWLVSQPISHRGLFNENCPENSLSAFKNSIKNKLAIELDVSISADGVPFVFHDEKLARMTGENGYISHLNSSEISKLKLLDSKDKIPTLKEVLELVDGKVPLLIEIKNFGKVGPIEKNVWKVLEGYNGEYAIQSFNPYSLEWFKINAPKVKRGQLASFFRNKEIIGVKRFYLKRMLLNKKISEPNFIVYSSEDMPNKYVKKYFGKIPVLTYTIRNDEEEKRLENFVDNFIFDSYIPESVSNSKNAK